MSQARLPRCLPLITRESSPLSTGQQFGLHFPLKYLAVVALAPDLLVDYLYSSQILLCCKVLYCPGVHFWAFLFMSCLPVDYLWIVDSRLDHLLPALDSLMLGTDYDLLLAVLTSCLSLDSELSCLYFCLCWWLTMPVLPRFQLSFVTEDFANTWSRKSGSVSQCSFLNPDWKLLYNELESRVKTTFCKIF